jgi:hypothetical protein
MREHDRSVWGSRGPAFRAAGLDHTVGVTGMASRARTLLLAMRGSSRTSADSYGRARRENPTRERVTRHSAPRTWGKPGATCPTVRTHSDALVITKSLFASAMTHPDALATKATEPKVSGSNPDGRVPRLPRWSGAFVVQGGGEKVLGVRGGNQSGNTPLPLCRQASRSRPTAVGPAIRSQRASDKIRLVW